MANVPRQLRAVKHQVTLMNQFVAHARTACFGDRLVVATRLCMSGVLQLHVLLSAECATSSIFAEPAVQSSR